MAKSNGNNFNFEHTDPFSISLWVKPDTGIAENRQIVAKTDNLLARTESGYALFYNTGGLQGTKDRVILFVRDSGLNLFSVSSTLGLH